LSSSALGLLLVFRTNGSYARWKDARKLWSKIVAQSRNMIRMASMYCANSSTESMDPKHTDAAMERLSLCTWLLCRSHMNRLLGPEDEEDYRTEVRQMCATASNEDRFGKLAERIIEVGNNNNNNEEEERFFSSSSSPSRRTMAALAELSTANEQLPGVLEAQRRESDKSLVLISTYITDCERIFTSPVPLVYTRHTARFLSLYLLLLPLPLYDAFTKGGSSLAYGFAVIPSVALLALFLFGIEELAVQLEEPFSVLPMQTFCDDVKESSQEIIAWTFHKQ